MEGFDQSAESRFWQAKAKPIAEEVCDYLNCCLRGLQKPPNTYCYSESTYDMFREIRQIIKKYT